MMMMLLLLLLLMVMVMVMVMMMLMMMVVTFKEMRKQISLGLAAQDNQPRHFIKRQRRSRAARGSCARKTDEHAMMSRAMAETRTVSR